MWAWPSITFSSLGNVTLGKRCFRWVHNFASLFAHGANQITVSLCLSLLWSSTVGYPSDSLGSCFIFIIVFLSRPLSFHFL